MGVFHVRRTPPPEPAEWVKSAEDATELEAVEEFPFYHTNEARTIARVRLVPSGSEPVIAHDTNYGAYALSAYAHDGTQTEIGFISTKTVGQGGTGNLTPWGSYDFTLLTSAVPAAHTLALLPAKQGSGVKFPSLTVIVEFAS